MTAFARRGVMDISREEQRVLHALAQGGMIHALKNDKGRITGVGCYNRDGWRLDQCDLRLFSKLRRKKAIMSEGGQPYRITQRGLELVRAECDNR